MKARVEQEPTQPVSVKTIMRSKAFALGVSDARAGKPPRPDYERWDANDQWNYERGRAWALLVPRKIPLRRNGELNNPDAVRRFARVRALIL